jgi:hypothetical protein
VPAIGAAACLAENDGKGVTISKSTELSPACCRASARANDSDYLYGGMGTTFSKAAMAMIIPMAAVGKISSMTTG